MQSIVLITNCSQILNLINSQCKGDDIISYTKENQLNIEMENGRVYITLSNEIVEDFEYDEMQNIHNIFPDAIFFYLMCYTSNAVLKKIIQRLTFQEKVYVDDDRGNIFTFTEFKEYYLHTFGIDT